MTHAARVADTATDGSAAERDTAQPRPRVLLALLIAPLGAFGATAWVGLNLDAEYVFGGLRTAELGGAGGPASIFVARPLAFRLLFAGLDDGRALVTGDGSSPLAQLVVRIEAVLLVTGIALLLWWGLRRHLARTEAAAVPAAVAAALAIAPNHHFLSPDWAGVLVAVAAIGAALGPRRALAGSVAGGVLIWLTVAVKVATAPLAVLALLVIALFAPRRAVSAGVLGAALTGMWLLLTRLFEPLEWTWLHDLVAVVGSSPLNHGITLAGASALLRAVANLVVVCPVVAVLPAALFALVLGRPRGRRGLAVLVALAAVVLSLASAVGQGEWYSYQFAGVPVLAAGAMAAALCQARAARLPLVLVALLAGVASAVLLGRPLTWRVQHVTPVLAGYLSLVVLGALWVLLGHARRDPGAVRTGWLLGGSLALSATLVAAGLPGSAYAFDGFDDAYTNSGLLARESSLRVQFDQVRARIGAGTPVLYLAYGTSGYLLGNPASCRYPAPEWLHYSTYLPSVRELASYRDDVRCVTDDATARYLVVDPSWAEVRSLAPQVRDRLVADFDCTQPLRVTDGKTTIQICPRR